MSWRRVLGPCAALVIGLSAHTERAVAQSAPTIKVEADSGPHYAGDVVSIRLIARGFDEEPTPQASVAPPATGRLELAGVSPSVNQSISIINGRMTRTREVSHVFQFRFTAAEQGNVSVGPFRITQGALSARAPAVRLAMNPVPTTDDLAVRVELPEGSVYVGERVPVVVEFELGERLGENLLSYDLRVPLFDDEESFRFLEPDAGGSQAVILQTPTGQIEIQGRTREVQRGGKTYTVVSFERTVVPLVAGKFEVPAATLSLMEGVRWQRDFFGGRRATRQRRWGARDRAKTLEVLEIPGGTAPPSFAGAIGSGFTFDVAADRSVVQVGDPITLTLTLHGEGVETANMPRLDAEGLLPGSQFRVQDTDLFGERVGDAKRFVAVVRVLDEQVGEIPALAYSWFDAETQQYEKTLSRPIALSVRSAEVIGAADVESGEATDATSQRAGEPGEAARDAAPVRARSFALTGADLAIERDPARLLGGHAAALGGGWLVPSLYVLGCLALPVAYWDRRRRDVDPVIAERRRVAAEERANVAAAVKLPRAEAVSAIAASLRRMLAQAPDAGSSELDALLGECDAMAYAPESAAGALGEAFVERAVALASALQERVS